MVTTLTISGTPGLTLIDDAESITDWSNTPAGAASFAVGTANFIEGSNSLQRKMATGVKGAWHNLAASVNFTTGNKHIFINWNFLHPHFLESRFKGGVAIRIGSSTSNFNDYYIDGIDTYQGGWKITVIDPNKTPSNIGGAGATLTAITHIGMVVNPVSSPGGSDPNFFMDASYYGEGYQVTTTSASITWADIKNADVGTSLNPVDRRSFPNYGIVSQDANGFIHVLGQQQWGDGSGTLIFDMDTTSAPQIVLFDNPTFAANVAAAIQDDGTVFSDETADANDVGIDDVLLLPGTAAVDDAVYFGGDETFFSLLCDISTGATGTYTIIWEYFDGTAYVALTGVVDGTAAFQTTGETEVKFDLPSDWAVDTVNSQGPFFYIRARVATFSSGGGGTGDIFKLTTSAQSTTLLKINLAANSTGVTTLEDDGSQWIGGGQVVSADLDATDQNVTDLVNTSFSNLRGSVVLPSSGSTKDIQKVSFTNQGQVDPGSSNFDDSSINSSFVADGGMLIDESISAISGMTFNSDGTGHAIKITATGSYTFTNFSFAGYGASDTTDAAVFNDSGGAVTLTITGGTTPTVRNGSGASTTVVASVSINIHVEDTAGADIENAQVSVHRAVVVAETSGAGNTVGDFTLVITGTIPADQPQTGYLSVLDRSTELTQGFRYASHTGSTFTLITNITGTVNSGGTATALNSTDIDFLTADIEEGDSIRNTTTGEWAIIDEITDADNVVTTPLTSGIWGASDAVEIHELVTTLISAVDIVDMPLFNAQTDANGDAPTFSYDSAQAPTAVVVRVRSNQDSTKYIPFKTSGTISATTGLTLNITLQEDTVAT